MEYILKATKNINLLDLLEGFSSSPSESFFLFLVVFRMLASYAGFLVSLSIGSDSMCFLLVAKDKNSLSVVISESKGLNSIF